MATGSRINPYVSFRFKVEVKGLIVGGFSELSGLQVETETEDFQEGGVNGYVHKLPKATRQQNLVLKRGITYSDVLWGWYQKTVSGKIERKSGSIVLMDSQENEAWRWEFSEAYPVKWIGPEFRGDSEDVAIESLELAYNGLRKG